MPPAARLSSSLLRPLRSAVRNSCGSCTRLASPNRGAKPSSLTTTPWRSGWPPTPRVAFLSFIGSARVGWSLRSKLAPGARCALEHGGAAPAIVERSADLDQVIEPMVKGGYYHAGQVCVSTQRIFVHADIQAEFVERFAARVGALRVGDPLSPEIEVGPLIHPREVEPGPVLDRGRDRRRRAPRRRRRTALGNHAAPRHPPRAPGELQAFARRGLWPGHLCLWVHQAR